jgi:hypothetical protein
MLPGFNSKERRRSVIDGLIRNVHGVHITAIHEFFISYKRYRDSMARGERFGASHCS